ncbi:hypothetical protein ABZ726_38410 [Streptomyces hundungensis]|uniref:hypothetical protein n=1 Tax=Streptomyces hundungensis TaxID=1077946 RepID=UPI0033DDA29A
MPSLTPSQAHYRRLREQGDWHAPAQRNLFNRMIGRLYHRLQKRELLDGQFAFPAPSQTGVAAA